MIKAEDQGLEPRSVFNASRFQDGVLIQPDVFHEIQKCKSAPNEDRTRRDLIDNQVPPPGGLKGSKFLQRVTDRN